MTNNQPLFEAEAENKIHLLQLRRAPELIHITCDQLKVPPQVHFSKQYVSQGFLTQKNVCRAQCFRHYFDACLQRMVNNQNHFTTGVQS